MKSQIKSVKNQKQDTRHPKHKTSPPFRILYFIVFFFSFLLNSNTLKNGYVLDDDVVYKQNQYVQNGLSSIKDIFSHGFLFGFNQMNNQSYRPMTTLFLAVEKAAFGNNPKINHFFHILFYSVSNVLLLMLLLMLFRNYHYSISLVITLLYAAHPIHTEVVASITSRTEILSLFFSLLAMIFLMKGLLSFKGMSSLGGMASLSALFYFCSLLSKENSITLAFVIPFLLYFFTSLEWKKILSLSLIYFGVMILYLLIRNAVLDTVVFGEKLDIINNGLMAAKTKSEMVATNFVILGNYVSLLFFPHPLSWDYSYNHFPITGWADLKSGGSFLLYLALGIYSLLALKKKDPIAFGILFFILTLSVTSNLFIKIGATLGERFLYTPSIGFCIAIVFLIMKIFKKILPENFSKVTPDKNRDGKDNFEQLNLLKMPPLLLVFGVILLLYSFKTYNRNADWKNNFALFSSGLEACPNSSRAHFAIGYEYRVAGEREPDKVKKQEWFDKAVAAYKKCVEIYPAFTAGWYNLGVTFYSANDPDNALKAYTETLKTDSTYYQAMNNAGVIYFNRKDFHVALKFFERAIKVSPTYSDPYANTGAVYHNLGDLKKALTYYEKALQIDPNNKNVLSNMSRLYGNMGDKEKANYYGQKAGMK